MTDQTQIDEIDAEELENAPEIETPEPPAKEWTDDDENEARAFGWKAPEEWAGEKPSGYIDDPRRYLERAESFRPFKVLREKAEKEKADFDARIARMEAITAKTLEAQKAQYERDMEAIRRQQLEAVETADRDRYEALEQAKSKLTRPPEAPEQPARASPIEHEVDEYAKTNDWVKNPILRQAGAQLIEANGYAGRPVREQLEFAEREVRKLYPGAFQPAPVATPQKPVAQRVDGGGLGGSAKSSAFAALPSEAKNAFARFVEQGIFENTDAGKKRYADEYNNA
jgi:hypothetical protein